MPIINIHHLPIIRVKFSIPCFHPLTTTSISLSFCCLPNVARCSILYKYSALPSHHHTIKFSILFFHPVSLTSILPSFCITFLHCLTFPMSSGAMSATNIHHYLPIITVSNFPSFPFIMLPLLPPHYYFIVSPPQCHQVRPHGAWCPAEDQEWDWPLTDLPSILQGRHLWLLQHEHWRREHSCLHQVILGPFCLWQWWLLCLFVGYVGGIYLNCSDSFIVWLSVRQIISILALKIIIMKSHSHISLMLIIIPCPIQNLHLYVIQWKSTNRERPSSHPYLVNMSCFPFFITRAYHHVFPFTVWHAKPKHSHTVSSPISAKFITTALTLNQHRKINTLLILLLIVHHWHFFLLAARSTQTSPRPPRSTHCHTCTWSRTWCQTWTTSMSSTAPSSPGCSARMGSSQVTSSTYSLLMIARNWWVTVGCFGWCVVNGNMVDVFNRGLANFWIESQMVNNGISCAVMCRLCNLLYSHINILSCGYKFKLSKKYYCRH